MNSNNKKKKTTNKKKENPICIGAGLVALDIVINGDPKIPLKLFAGGSCGNVLTILSFLKWNAFPVARLKSNDASKKLLADLTDWNVNTLLITKSPDGSTPIIIQRIKRDKNGNSIHTFQFRNPENGDWLPLYKPVLRTEVDSLIKKSPIPSVFYFDRVNRSSIDLAKYYKGKGAVIFFEPSSMSENKQFEECLNVADIIKFSNERINNYADLFPDQRVPLEIETLGKEGLRYRFSHQLKSKNWINLTSYKISYVVDAAGSGDWFSAGVISKIAMNGLKGFKNRNEVFVSKSLKYGQALGALNCFFEGARGLMYALTKEQVGSLVRKLQRSKTPLTLINKKEDFKPIEKFSIGSLY
jgi:fructokinase